MTANSPPIKQMLAMDVPVGGGTDGTRVASYNPWVGLYWLVSGKTVGGLSLYPEANRFDRMAALRLYTASAAWFSNQEGNKGAIVPGQLADLAVLSDDYFSIPEERIKHLESVLTIVDGKPVYAAAEFQELAPPPLPISPDWSPVAYYGGYHNQITRSSVLRSPQIGSTHIGCCSPSGSLASTSSFSLNKTGSLSTLWQGVGCACAF